MAWKVLATPRGGYQIYSTVTDTFLFDSPIDAWDLIKFWKDHLGRQGVTSLLSWYIEIDTSEWERAVISHEHYSGHSDKLDPDTCSICRDILRDREI